MFRLNIIAFPGIYKHNISFVVVLYCLIYDEGMEYNFYTIADVADMLKVSQGAIRNLINSGELKAIQIGGRGLWRIEASAIEDYIKRQYLHSQAKIDAGDALVD